MFLCVFSDKLHQGDTELFRQLTGKGKPCIFVRNKTDLIYEEGMSLEESEASIRRDVAASWDGRISNWSLSVPGRMLPPDWMT